MLQFPYIKICGYKEFNITDYNSVMVLYTLDTQCISSVMQVMDFKICLVYMNVSLCDVQTVAISTVIFSKKTCLFAA